MATLEITYDEIRRHIGRFMGATRTPDDLTTIDAQDIEDALSGGLREVYWPSGDGHIWSFLRREGTVTLVASTRAYDLPTDFTQMTTGLYYPEGSGNRQITVITEEKHRALIGKTSDDGEPIYAVVRAESAELAKQSRTKYMVSFYPKPAVADTISFTYAFEPPTIEDGINPWPLGGAMHSEMILESCLASAEKIMNPESGPGIHTEKFRELLANSIARDKLLTQVREEDELWPLAAIEGSTGNLEIDHTQLLRLTGMKMGYGPNPDIWTHTEIAKVEQMLRLAMREYYWPVSEGDQQHVWSFLRKEADIALVVDQTDYDLPENFSQIMTGFFLQVDAGEKPIAIISESKRRSLIANVDETGTPLYAVVRSKTVGGDRTTYEVSFYPKPDAVTTVSFTYAIEPPILSASDPKPLGGAMHAMLVIDAAAATVEKLTGKEGASIASYAKSLAGSIARDKRVTDFDDESDVWPLDATEGSTGTLEIDREQLKRIVGNKLGHGPNPQVWNHSQDSEVEQIIRMGLREVYWPAIDGERYSWSFLESEETIDVISGTQLYDLPADFSRLMTSFNYSEGSDKKPLSVIADEEIQALISRKGETGTATYCSIAAKKAIGADGSRTTYEVTLYPQPDEDVTLTFTYEFEPPILTVGNPYPLGGAKYARLFMEGCLSACESMKGEEGLHSKKFQEMLSSAIQGDKSLTAGKEEESWPLDSAEGSTGTLEVDREQLKRLIGSQLTFGANPSSWSHGEDSQVEQVLRMGLREFYWPPGGESGNRHFWSFLRNEGTLDVVIGEQTYDLPADFSRLLTNLNYPEADGGLAIEVIGEEEIQAMLGSSGETGTPLYCAITAKKATTADGSRTTYQVILYPQPTAATTLSFTYSFEPPILTADNPRPLGGAMYSHLVVEAVLSAAEKLNGEEGGHTKRFQELLSASIDSDRTLTETNVGVSWPKDGIAGSTGDLSINKAQLKRLVGWKNEYGPNPARWSHSQNSEVEEIVRMGLRSFYNPMVLPGERAPHNWSFMRPVVMISTSASLYAYDLPEDFAVLHGPITYTPGESVIYPPIKVTAERYVDNKLQVGEGSGRPLEAAIRIKYDDDRVAGEAQVWELILWPIPDAVYKLNVPYSINAEHLSDDTSLPLGGQPHAQTLIESCLAAAENMSGQKGVHTEKLMLCLQASIGHDREVESPDTMGVFHSHYDDSGSFSNGQHGFDEHSTLYNGVSY